MYMHVTEKSPEIVAYEVPEGVVSEQMPDIAREIAKLPGVREVSVQFRDGGKPILTVSAVHCENVAHISMGGWLVIRPTASGPHYLDKSWLIDDSGLLMFYSVPEFQQRYQLEAAISGGQ